MSSSARASSLQLMNPIQKAQQELDQIERQVALIEANAGQNEGTRKQLDKLQERVRILMEEMKGLQTAWQKTELARHPQRPQTLDYIERVFTDFSEKMCIRDRLCVMSNFVSSDCICAGFFHASFAFAFFWGTRNCRNCACNRGRMMRAAYCALTSSFEGTITSASIVHSGTLSFFAADRRQDSGSRIGFSSLTTSAGLTSSQNLSRLWSGNRRSTKPILRFARDAAISGIPSAKKR